MYMPTVKVALVRDTHKVYPDAKATMGNDRTLFVKRDSEVIAQFLAEHYKYWEYEDQPNQPTRS
jgi:hypothetical protein